MELLNNHAKHQARMNKTPSKLMEAMLHGGLYITVRELLNKNKLLRNKNEHGAKANITMQTMFLFYMDVSKNTYRAPEQLQRTWHKDKLECV
jgi:hypothetical protein